jgi:hypothetical protein
MGVFALLFPPNRDSKTLFIVLIFFLSFKKIVSGYFPLGYLNIFATIIIPASILKTGGP